MFISISRRTKIREQSDFRNALKGCLSSGDICMDNLYGRLLDFGFENGPDRLEFDSAKHAAAITEAILRRVDPSACVTAKHLFLWRKPSKSMKRWRSFASAVQPRRVWFP